mmetsp:Transcript_15181/g.54657  ORF Transcript_15181/g.54657 Transcript_15181/m.54657 type:complete len:82 (-) Transcript_15181:162-407(-)
MNNHEREVRARFSDDFSYKTYVYTYYAVTDSLRFPASCHHHQFRFFLEFSWEFFRFFPCFPGYADQNVVFHPCYAFDRLLR